MTFSLGNTKAGKLNAELALQIREKYATGLYTYARLSIEYDVSENTIRSVVKGTSWRRVPMVQPATQLAADVQRSLRKLDELMNGGEGLPPASTELSDDMMEAMERAAREVAQTAQNSFKPSADIAARMAAYGVAVVRPTNVGGATSEEVGEDNNSPKSSGLRLDEENKTKGAIKQASQPAQPPAHTAGPLMKESVNVNQSSSEECHASDAGAAESTCREDVVREAEDLDSGQRTAG